MADGEQSELNKASNLNKALEQYWAWEQPQNDRERITNTAVAALSGILKGDPLAAVKQAVVANQQPTTLEAVAASGTNVTLDPRRALMPPTMEQIQRGENPNAELQRKDDQQRDERKEQTNPALSQLGIAFDRNVDSHEVVCPPVPGGAGGGPIR